jgi:hypothetical protein
VLVVIFEDELSVVGAPAQIVVEEALAVTIGVGFIVTVTLTVLEHPPAWGIKV